MTSAWRIDKARRSKADSFSGEGATIEGGRWNQPGTRMVYSAETLSLAVIEKFVHMGDEGRSLRLASYRIDVPSDVRIEELKKSELPKDWRAFPTPQSTMDIGSNWARKAHSAVLKVPSVVIETEHNYLMNPLHPDFKRLKIQPAKSFCFDPRMWKGEQQKADAKTFIAYNHYQEPDGKSPEVIKELQWVVDLNYRDPISYILAKKLLATFEPIVPPQP